MTDLFALLIATTLVGPWAWAGWAAAAVAFVGVVIGELVARRGAVAMRRPSRILAIAVVLIAIGTASAPSILSALQDVD